MRKILTFAAGLIMMTACAQKSQKASVQSEPSTITWIADKPEPTLQPHELYPEVPDSLWDALGLQKGVPSSMSCLLLQTEGKAILLDAGLGAPFSQLLPIIKSNMSGDIKYLTINTVFVLLQEACPNCFQLLSIFL